MIVLILTVAFLCSASTLLGFVLGRRLGVEHDLPEAMDLDPSSPRYVCDHDWNWASVSQALGERQALDHLNRSRFGHDSSN